MEVQRANIAIQEGYYKQAISEKLKCSTTTVHNAIMNGQKVF